jgi:hypothetical protein
LRTAAAPCKDRRVSETDEKPGLLARAQELETEAANAGEETSSGRELRTQAARLRVEALGQKSYPVQICSECARVTGWVSGSGQCDLCLRREQLNAAYADPHGGFVSLDDGRPVHRVDERSHSGHGTLARLLGGHAARERATTDAWLACVDPDTTGPIDPEVGFQLEAARRDQFVAADGTGTVIRFRTATQRFDGSDWIELETTTIGLDGLLVPTEHSAGLPADQLVDAWLDYKQAVEAVNRERWSGESARRETARIQREDREEAMRRQRDAAELLDEGRL